MKRAAAFICILVFITLSGCSGGTGQIELPTDAQGNYAGFDGAPESCTLEEAGNLGYYVTLDLEDFKNRDVWDRFVRAAQGGQDAYIRLAQFHSAGENKPYYLDLYYLNGSYYLFDESAGKQKPEPYPYLLTLRGTDGIPPKENTAVVLSEDASLTYTDVIKTLYSSTIPKEPKKFRIVFFRNPAGFT